MCLLSARTVWLWVQREDDDWNLPSRSRNHFGLPHRRVLSDLEEGLEKRVRLIFQEKNFCSGRLLMKVDGFSRRSPPRVLTVPSATGSIKLSPFIGVNASFALSLLAWSSDASISSNSSLSAINSVSFPGSPRIQCITEEYTWQANLM